MKLFQHGKFVAVLHVEAEIEQYPQQNKPPQLFVSTYDAQNDEHSLVPVTWAVARSLSPNDLGRVEALMTRELDRRDAIRRAERELAKLK